MIYANFRQRLFFFFQMEAFESWCASLRWLSGKESACQCRKSRFDPWVGKISYSRNWHSTPGFLPGKFYRQRSLAGYSPWGHKQLDTTEYTRIVHPSRLPRLEQKLILSQFGRLKVQNQEEVNETMLLLKALRDNLLLPLPGGCW